MSALGPNVLQNSLPHCDSATIESSSMARRINVAHFCLILNQCCVCCPLKIVLQHNPPKSGHVQCKVRCPLRAAKSGHEPLSLDYLIGAPDKRVRHREAECFRGLKIDDEFNLGGLLDR